MANRRKRTGLLALGAALLLSGTAFAELTEVRISEITLDQGFRFHVPPFPRYSLSGYSPGIRNATGIGDFNGDGLDDFCTADYTARLHVIFGSHSVTTETLEIAHLDGKVGFEIQTFQSNERLEDLAALGDINGDGFDDFGISTLYHQSFVIYGTDEPQPAVQQLADLYDAGKAFRVFTRFYGDLSAAGDVNGDGFDDFLVGLADDWQYHLSAAYIVFGKASGFPADLRYKEMREGEGIVFLAREPGHYAGNEVAGIGDVNGDGIDDIAIAGAPFGPWPPHPGEVYVIFGSRDLAPMEIGESYVDGKKGFRIEGPYAGEERMEYLTSVSDVTGDGISDFLSYAYYYPPVNGAAHLYFGRNDRSHSNIVANDPNYFFTFTGDTGPPYKVMRTGNAGDTNGDGFFDFQISTVDGGTGVGQSDLLLKLPQNGTAVVLPSLVEFRGVRFVGEPNWFFPASPSTAGDFNGDGMSDISFAAPFHTTTPDGCYAYIVYGSTEETSATYKAYVPPGNTAFRGIGKLASAERSSPESRFWISYESGHDGSSSASLQTVTIHRNASQVANLLNNADVLWHSTSNRVEWSSARVMVKYIKREIEGLREENLVLYHAPTPEGPWIPCEEQLLDTKRGRISGVVHELGYFALAAEPSGDVNMDNVLDAADLARFQFHIANQDTVTTEVLIRGDLSPLLTGDDQITSADLEVARKRILGF